MGWRKRPISCEGYFMNATQRLTRSGPTPKIGVVHLGPGAFFRAFNAVYTDDAIADAGGDWGICAVSLRSSSVRDHLAPQGFVYSAVEKGPSGDKQRVVQSVAEVLVAPEDPEAVLARMVDVAVRVVSLTITEKGYCHSPATGRLDLQHPDIQYNLQAPGAPRSAVGFLVEALERRCAAGLAPFTVLSCDNLPSNGALLRRVVLDFAKVRGGSLADWIATEVPFPATMVDRITPATTEADIEALSASTGVYDPGCVVHEPFRQWVIEDNFACGRPAWEAGGAQFVGSVEAHELMKLRCLNGTHSALAYLGYLAGYQTIAEAVADPAFSGLCERLWRDEILPTVPPPEGEDLASYTAALLERYRNPSIRHRTWQIAMDGSQKLPQRLLGTVRDHLREDRVPQGLCLAVAGWMRYVGGVDEAGGVIDVRDPLAGRLKEASDGVSDAAGKVAALLGVEEVFGRDLPQNAAFGDALVSAYSDLLANGAKRAVEAYVASTTP